MREILPNIERESDPGVVCVRVCVCVFQRTMSRTTKKVLQIFEGCHSGPSNVEFSRPSISCFSNHLC